MKSTRARNQLIACLCILILPLLLLFLPVLLVACSAAGFDLLSSSPRNGHLGIYLVDLNVLGGLEALRGPQTPAEVILTP